MERKIRKLWWTPIAAIFLIVMLLSPLVMVHAQSEAWAAVLARGNARYEVGDYPGAIEKYKMITDSGVKNGQVYYNLGNAYFKNEQLGEAIVNYERAQKLMPRDKDVAANLLFTNFQVVDRVDLPAEAAIVRWIDRMHDLATINETLWWTWVIYWLIAILGVIAIFVWRTRRVLVHVLAVLGIIFVLSLISLGVKIQDAGVTQAIVTAPKVNVYSGPGDDYMLQFTVHEGSKFDVEGERQEWYRVRLGGDLEGWAPKDALTVV